MNSQYATLPFAVQPRGANFLGSLAARILRKLSTRRPKGDLDMTPGEVLALAERYDQSQPGFANDLRAAVAAWDAPEGGARA